MLFISWCYKSNVFIRTESMLTLILSLSINPFFWLWMFFPVSILSVCTKIWIIYFELRLSKFYICYNYLQQSSSIFFYFVTAYIYSPAVLQICWLQILNFPKIIIIIYKECKSRYKRYALQRIARICCGPRIHCLPSFAAILFAEIVLLTSLRSNRKV